VQQVGTRLPNRCQSGVIGDQSDSLAGKGCEILFAQNIDSIQDLGNSVCRYKRTG